MNSLCSICNFSKKRDFNTIHSFGHPLTPIDKHYLNSDTVAPFLLVTDGVLDGSLCTQNCSYFWGNKALVCAV